MTAQDLHQKGRQAGEQGQYDEAILYFEQAHEADPQWPYPLYDMAFTYLLKDNHEKAYEYYKKTNELAPEGFYTVKTALWTLDREETGQFAEGLYTAYVKTEWIPEADRKTVLEDMRVKFPDFVPVYKSLLALYDSPQKRMELIEEGLAQDADDETYGILLVHKAIILKFSNRQEEAKAIIEDYLASPRCTAGNRGIAKTVLEDQLS